LRGGGRRGTGGRYAWLLALILLLTAIKGVLWSAAVPLWQGPDENRHFATIQYIAEHGRLPDEDDLYHDDENVLAGELTEVSRLWYNPEQRQTFGPGDEGPNEAALAALDPSLRTSTERGKVTLALHLPPLYYLMGVPLYLLARGGDILARVFAVRQLSVGMAVGAVALAAAIARQVFPQRRAMWATVPLLVSFQPMFTLSTSTVNTDALLILAFCALIYLSIRVLKKRMTAGLAAAMGVCLAAGLLTKPFILAIAVPLAVVLAWDVTRAIRLGAGLRRTLLCWGGMAAAVALLWGPWVWHSARLGNNPFYANPIRTGQLVVEHPFYDYRLGQYLVDYGRSLLGGTWATLWGYFGWLETPLDPTVYRVLYVVCALALVGLGVDVARKVRARAWDAELGLLGFLALVGLSMVGTLGAINYYSWRARGVGGGIQGRYYLGAVVPLAVLLAAGLTNGLPARWRPVGQWLLSWAAILLHAVAFFQVLLPRYYL
jgi:4-amino-4-deoxy-L-arabinose transferase-like glycosyltransferase